MAASPMFMAEDGVAGTVAAEAGTAAAAAGMAVEAVGAEADAVAGAAAVHTAATDAERMKAARIAFSVDATAGMRPGTKGVLP